MKKNIKEEVIVYFEVCRGTAIIPKYAKEGDAGMDVFSAEEIIIAQGETKIVPTGLKVAIPEGYEIQVRPRSGISFKTALRISNSPGTIDSGYRDEIGIIVTNTSIKENEKNILLTIDSNKGEEGAIKVRIGDRIAQFVLQVVPKMKIEIVNCVKDIGNDRGGGFGSTGTKY